MTRAAAPDRIPCIRHGKGCRRTAAKEKYDDPGTQIVCGKCWRQFVPNRLKRRYKLLGRESRRLKRKRAPDPFQIARLDRMNQMLWRAIRRALLTPAKPDGLDAFLEESGL